MKLKAKNFTGNRNFDYKVEFETELISGENRVTFYLKLKVNGEYELLSAAAGDYSKDFSIALRSSLLRAEEKFNMDLSTIDIDNLKSA